MHQGSDQGWHIKQQFRFSNLLIKYLRAIMICHTYNFE